MGVIKRGYYGLSLVEMIIVIFAIAIFLAAGIPAYMKVMDKSRRTACDANLTSIANMYEAEQIYDKSITIDDILDNEDRKYLTETPLCPDDGVYCGFERIDRASGGIETEVCCSRHSAGAMPVYAYARRLTRLVKRCGNDDAVDALLTASDPDAPVYERMRAQTLYALGGKWPALEDETVEKLVWNGVPLVYKAAFLGSGNSALVCGCPEDEGGAWLARMVYDPVSGYWYEYVGSSGCFVLRNEEGEEQTDVYGLQGEFDDGDEWKTVK